MTNEANTPLVSVCIANYNGEHIVADCIESVLAQKNAPRFEILVHDDASTDASLSVLQGFAAIRLIKSSKNVGFCVSNNRMAAAAKGQFILLLNNDAQLFDDALATLLSESRTRADNVVLGLPQYDASSRELIDHGLRLDFFCSPVPLRKPATDAVAMVMGACIWVPTSLWQETGGFPEWFETNAEDVYLCCYARFLGYDIYVPKRSGFYHMIGHSLGGGKSTANRLQISTRRRYFSERNRLFVQWIFYPAWMALLTTSANLVALSLEAVILSIVNRKFSIVADIYIKSQLDAVAALPTVLRVRKRAMRSKKISTFRFFSTFTFIPQKLRLVFSVGIPRT